MTAPDEITIPDGESTLVLPVQGPFSLLADGEIPCVLDVDERRAAGIYIWTVSLDGGELVHYVGETGRSFGERFTEHLMWYLSGRYPIYDPTEFAAGRRVLRWKSMYRSYDLRRSADFLKQGSDLLAALEGQLRALRIWLVPMNHERRERALIEGAIARAFIGQPAPIGTFQEEGGRYQYRGANEPATHFRLASEARFFGLPEALST